MMSNDSELRQQALWRLPRITKFYKSFVQSGLSVAEQFCLEFVPKEKRNSVLDIGVGAGRTTRVLLKLFKSYLGVDYSDRMIDVAKMLFPDADLRVMDARSLEFHQQFDCVLFSFNGIDCVEYNDRRLIFEGMVRALRPGGFFIYSTHNIQNRRVCVWQNFLVPAELFRGWKRLFPVLRSVANRMRNFLRQSIDEKGRFAYVNDPAADFATILTYVDIDSEINSLTREHGLKVLAAIGNTRSTPGYGPDDSWVYIVAQRLSL